MDEDAVVSSEWVSEHLDDPSVVLVDTRLPNFYTQAHLPGAVNLPTLMLSLAGPVSIDGVPAPGPLAQRLGHLGITADSHIVLYDDGRGADAARLYWILKLYRHRHVSVLDGGITKWRHDGNDWEYSTGTPEPASYEIAALDREQLATTDEVRTALDDPNTVIVDVRSPAEFLGIDLRAQRAGHIPGAVNVDWTNNLEEDENGITQARGANDLRDLYAAGGVTPERTVIVHCQSGDRSSAAYLA
ncbi:MAG: sulfurtransferase, partial [Chloroflexota bacterium]